MRFQKTYVIASYAKETGTRLVGVPVFLYLWETKPKE